MRAGRRARPDRVSVTPARERRSREAARLLRRASTAGEQLLWDAMRNRRLDGRKFRRQQPIAGFVVDFYCPEERLAVEVERSIHMNMFEADAARQAIIESAGISFVRVSDELVRTNITAALAMISAAFAANARTASDSPSPLDGEGAGG